MTDDERVRCIAHERAQVVRYLQWAVRMAAPGGRTATIFTSVAAEVAAGFHATDGPTILPPPRTDGDGEPVWPMVLAELQAGVVAEAGPGVVERMVRLGLERDQIGRVHYGVALRVGDGRTIRDATEEAADLALYLRREVAERPGDVEVRATYQFALELWAAVTLLEGTR